MDSRYAANKIAIQRIDSYPGIITFAQNFLGMKQLFLIISLLILTYSAASAQVDTTSQQLQDVVVTAAPGVKNRYRTENTEVIGRGQLQRAACCNLGESFTANPSVNVSYANAFAKIGYKIILLSDKS